MAYHFTRLDALLGPTRYDVLPYKRHRISTAVEPGLDWVFGL